MTIDFPIAIGRPLTFVYLHDIQLIPCSNSSQEIYTLFNDYQNQADAQRWPNAMTRATREGDYQTYKINSQQDVGAGGDITSYANKCVVIGSQQRALLGQ